MGAVHERVTAGHNNSAVIVEVADGVAGARSVELAVKNGADDPLTGSIQRNRVVGVEARWNEANERKGEVVVEEGEKGGFEIRTAQLLIYGRPLVLSSSNAATVVLF